MAPIRARISVPTVTVPPAPKVAESLYAQPSMPVVVLLCAHVGVDDCGKVGAIQRQGMEGATSACGSAVGAWAAVRRAAEAPCRDDDFQQYLVHKCIAAHADEIGSAPEPMAAIPKVILRTIEAAAQPIVDSGA